MTAGSTSLGGDTIAAGPPTNKSQRFSSPLGLILKAAEGIEESQSGEVTRTPVEVQKFLSATDDDGRTPILLAANSRSGDTVLCLLQHKASTADIDPSGNTPLLLALTNKDTASVNHLLAARANLDVRNTSGTGCFDAAGTPELLVLLQTAHDRRSVERRHPTTMQALPVSSHERAAGGVATRLRVEGLPGREDVQAVEDLIESLMGACQIEHRPVAVQIAEDPITCLTLGHAFLDFQDEGEASAALEAFGAKSNLHVFSERVAW